MILKNIFVALVTATPLALAGTLAAEQASSGQDPAAQQAPFGIVIHGGAGTLRRSELDAVREAGITAALDRALDAGYAVLERGGSSVDAVIAAVTVLEDSPHFNAGKGAVFTADRTHELDASLMNGKTLAAGAVAGVTTVKNPLQLARLVMDTSPHVLLAGPGADRFAAQAGVERVNNSWFDTPLRERQLERARKLEASDPSAAARDPLAVDHKFGTVGAVALDRQGNLAAGTSTGGMTNKRHGRVGDSPLIGAGTYADNGSCAVSATGHGEYFIRLAVAHDICARMAYGNATLQQAANAVVMKRLVAAGGSGGVIAIDAAGNIALPFSTEGMYRGFRLNSGVREVKLFRE